MRSGTSWSREDSTSPAWVSLSLATAPMSPGPNSSTCSDSLPWGASSWPTRSLTCARQLKTWRVVLEHALEDAEQVQAPGVGVGHRLEHQRHGVAVLAGLERQPVQLHRALHGRRGQVFDEGLEQARGAEVARGRAAGHREQLAGGDALLQRGHRLLVRDLLALEVALHQVLGQLGHLVHQLLAVLLGLRAELFGDVDLLRAAALAAVLAPGLHVDQVDDALELVLGPDRDLGGHDVAPEGLP